MLGNMPGMDVHWGLAVGVVACIVSWVLIEKTRWGFAARIAGGNVRAAQVQGLAVGPLIVGFTALAGGFAGLAGMIEVAAVQGSANASLAAGYGYTGILVAFLARHNPLAIIPVAILLGGIDASGGLIQRRMDLPDATVLVLQGMLFIVILFSETFYGRFKIFNPDLWKRSRLMDATDIGLWGVPLAILGGAIRVSTPFIFVSLGEAITERSGRINLGLEGTLVFGAMTAYAVAVMTGFALARRARGRGRRAVLRPVPRLDLQISEGQRHRHRHRPDAVRLGPRLLLRQAVHPAVGARPAGDRRSAAGRHAAGPGGAQHQRAVPDRRRACRCSCGGRSGTPAPA